MYTETEFIQNVRFLRNLQNENTYRKYDYENAGKYRDEMLKEMKTILVLVIDEL